MTKSKNMPKGMEKLLNAYKKGPEALRIYLGTANAAELKYYKENLESTYSKKGQLKVWTDVIRESNIRDGEKLIDKHSPKIKKLKK